MAFLTDRKRLSFFTEVAVPPGSPVIRQEPLRGDLFRRDGMRVVDVLRSLVDEIVLVTPSPERLARESFRLQETLSSASLRQLELDGVVRQAAREKPLLGICVAEHQRSDRLKAGLDTIRQEFARDLEEDTA